MLRGRHVVMNAADKKARYDGFGRGAATLWRLRT